MVPDTLHKGVLTFVPEPAAATPLVATLEAGGCTLGRADLTLAPAPRWDVHIVQHSHFDMGYTDLRTHVARQQKEYLDEVLFHIEATADWPDAARYRWCTEVTWGLLQYLEDRGPRQRERLLAAVRAGRIEVNAFLWHMHTEACTLEELARTLYPLAELRGRWGLPVESAMLSDVPGAVAALPDLLAGAGIRYFSMSLNNLRAPFHRLRGNGLPLPFLWEGPGGGRVLTWYSASGVIIYREADALGFTRDLATAERGLGEVLLGHGGLGHGLYLLRGSMGDNRLPDRTMATTVRAWNERWAYPRVQLSTLGRFFSRLEAATGGSVPVRRGDWTDWWADGLGSAPAEMGQVRALHRDVRQAEVLTALAGAAGSPERLSATEGDEAYAGILEFDEHTWGAARPEGEELDGRWSGRRQWQEKVAPLRRGEQVCARLRDRALQHLGERATRPGRGHALLVWNTLSWERGGPASFWLPWWYRGEPCAVVDAVTEEPVALEVRRHQPHPRRDDAPDRNDARYLACFASDRVPAFGRRAYRVLFGAAAERMGRAAAGGGPAPGSGAPVSVDPRTGCAVAGEWEVQADLRAGGLARLCHRPTGAELAGNGPLGAFVAERYRVVRDGVAEGFAQRLLERLPGGVNWRLDAARTWAGPVSATLAWQGDVPGGALFRQEAVLYAAAPRMTLCTRVVLGEPGQRAPREHFGAHLTFPFRTGPCQPWLQGPGGFLRPGADQLPGSCTPWYAVDRGLALAATDYTLAFCAVEAPLVQVGGITTAFDDRGVPAPGAPGHVCAYLWNDFWTTNFPVPPSGELVFTYHLELLPGTWDSAAAYRSLCAQQDDLVTVLLEGAEPAAEAGWCPAVEGPGVCVETLKPARDGRGVVARVLETAGSGGTVRLVLSPGMRAWRCDLLEQDLEPLRVTQGETVIEVGPRSLATVRIAQS